MKPITIDQLAVFVKKQQQLGNGSKFVLMSSDDECNEYHPAVRGGVELKDCVILT